MFKPSKRQALLALCLTAPVTSLGALMYLWIMPGTIGTAVIVLGQAWLLIFPVAWLLWVEQKPIRITKPRIRDGLSGFVVGLLMFVIILAAYWFLLRHWLDVDAIRLQFPQMFQTSKLQYSLGGVYVFVVNALIEEYFWRWFIYRQCEVLVSPIAAVVLSAVLFTAHHTIGLAFFTPSNVTIVGTLGVLLAGIVWSDIFRRSRRIWSNYVSHAIADIALHIVTWQILFS